MLTNDAQGIFRGDNHGWFFGWTNGMVFQARGTQSELLPGPALASAHSCHSSIVTTP